MVAIVTSSYCITCPDITSSNSYLDVVTLTIHHVTCAFNLKQFLYISSFILTLIVISTQCHLCNNTCTWPVLISRDLPFQAGAIHQDIPFKRHHFAVLFMSHDVTSLYVTWPLRCITWPDLSCQSNALPRDINYTDKKEANSKTQSNKCPGGIRARGAAYQWSDTCDNVSEKFPLQQFQSIRAHVYESKRHCQFSKMCHQYGELFCVHLPHFYIFLSTQMCHRSESLSLWVSLGGFEVKPCDGLLERWDYFRSFRECIDSDLKIVEELLERIGSYFHIRCFECFVLDVTHQTPTIMLAMWYIETFCYFLGPI